MVEMTIKNLNKYVKSAYDYAHEHCIYGRSDLSYPPGAPPKFMIDCVGLAYRALYEMGRYSHQMNIDQIINLCLSNGFSISYNESAVYKYNGFACYQNNGLEGTWHINHVYYSLGGSNINCINKYDLGSEERIKANQPFTNVAANEWTGKMHFYCHLYLEAAKTPDLPEISNTVLTSGIITADCGMYSGPGTNYRKVYNLKKNTNVLLHNIIVSSQNGNPFKLITYNGVKGYVYKTSVKELSFKEVKAIVTNTDSYLNLRQGPGASTPKIGEVHEGTAVIINGECTNSRGEVWANIQTTNKNKKLYGWVAKMHLKPIK